MKRQLGMRSEEFGVKSAVFSLAVVLLAVGAVVAVVHLKQGQAAKTQAKKTIYTCVMHHQIRREEPGDCPICGMTLVPLDQIFGSAPTPTAGNASAPQPKKVRYWVSPMDPSRRSDKPMKDEMGMDYVPVYEEESPAQDSGAPPEVQGLAPVHLTPYKEQLIGVKFATADMLPITHTLHTTGRFGGGEGDFANLATEFAAGQAVRPSARYVVADIYALDIPFVKIGEKAWVSPLSGSGPKVAGKVAQIYPYEGTQSRIIRVRINLSQGIPREVFANVDIEATTDPRLAVPSSAVMDTGTRQYVFVATAPGVFTPQTVTLGFRGDNLLEITSGLKPGDHVVDGANFMIDADSKINAAFAEEK